MSAPPRSIILALELSAGDPPLLAAGRTYARAFGAHLYLVHVVPPEPDFVGLPKEGEAEAPPPADQPRVGYAYDRTLEASRLREAHQWLEDRAREMADDGVQATALLIEGEPPDKLLAEADRLDVGLIILGSHQRGAIGEWLLGSTSRDVLRTSPRPVLVVPVHV